MKVMVTLKFTDVNTNTEYRIDDFVRVLLSNTSVKYGRIANILHCGIAMDVSNNWKSDVIQIHYSDIVAIKELSRKELQYFMEYGER